MNNLQRKQWSYLYVLRHEHVNSDRNRALLDIYMDQLSLGTIGEYAWKQAKVIGRNRQYNWTEHQYKMKHSGLKQFEPTINTYPKLRLV